MVLSPPPPPYQAGLRGRGQKAQLGRPWSPRRSCPWAPVGRGLTSAPSIETGPSFRAPISGNCLTSQTAPGLPRGPHPPPNTGLRHPARQAVCTHTHAHTHLTHARMYTPVPSLAPSHTLLTHSHPHSQPQPPRMYVHTRAPTPTPSPAHPAPALSPGGQPAGFFNSIHSF